MASPDHTVQFQEQPISPIPTHNASNSHPDADITPQFQEPISPQTTHDTSSSHKSTAEKLKEKVKKPFVKEDEVKSPELEAAVEVIEEKGMGRN